MQKWTWCVCVCVCGNFLNVVLFINSFTRQQISFVRVQIHVGVYRCSQRVLG